MQSFLRPRILACGLALAFVAAASHAWAQTSTVRVLFFTGPVTMANGARPSIGQALTGHDELTLASAATLQLSINGKVIKYAQPMKVRVADAIKRAGSGENAAVATTVRTLAAASSSSNGHTSQAGATRVEGSTETALQTKEEIARAARARADAEIKQYTGIDRGTERAEKIDKEYGNKNRLLVVLEPRATAVADSQITFRWMRTPDVPNYVVILRNHLGDILYRTETADTSATIPASTIEPEALYSWTLSDARDEAGGPEVTFNRLSASAAKDVSDGVSTIRRELGADNPALPLVLGAFYADHGCHGEAARYFTQGALITPEQYDEFMKRAWSEYAEPIGLQSEELETIYRPKTEQ